MNISEFYSVGIYIFFFCFCFFCFCFFCFCFFCFFCFCILMFGYNNINILIGSFLSGSFFSFSNRFLHQALDFLELLASKRRPRCASQ